MAENHQQWPWGEDRPGAAEARDRVKNPEPAEQELLANVRAYLQGKANEGTLMFEEAYLCGSFPLTEIAFVFRDDWRHLKGRRFGYRGWIWDDPYESAQLFLPHFGEVLNDLRQEYFRPFRFVTDEEGVIWIGRRPSSPRRGDPGA